MREHIPRPAPHVSVPLAGITLHQLQYQIRRKGLEGWPSDEGGATRDLFVEEHRVGVGLVVWGKSGEHLEDEDAERVPVHGFVVPLLLNDLGREVVGRPTQRPRCRIASLREPEVRYFDVSIDVEQYVFGLEIPVDDV